MGSTQAQHSTIIKAPAEVCFAAICDFESYPEWQSAIVDATILERDEEKRGKVVEFVLDIKVKKMRYSLRYHYDKSSYHLRWEYVEGDLKDVSGAYTFESEDDSTKATFSLEIDPGRFVPGPIKKVLSEQVMSSSVEELKKRAEAMHKSKKKNA